MKVTIGAVTINAISLERAEVEILVLTNDDEGNWIDGYGHQQYPYYTSIIELDVPPITEEWIAHLNQLARKKAVAAYKAKTDKRESDFTASSCSVVLTLIEFNT